MSTYFIAEVKVTKVTKSDANRNEGSNRTTALIGHITVPATDLESIKALAYQHINLLQDGGEIDIPKMR